MREPGCRIRTPNRGAAIDAPPVAVGPAAVADAVLVACRADVEVLKPGNVGIHGAGHGMHAADFLASAQAVAPLLSAPDRSVGERILAAVQATAAVVGKNTNLGIVLLAAPLAHAALLPDPEPALRARVRRVLAALTVADARAAYAAIRHARPGGLGRAPAHDVAEAPEVTLLEAMRSAAGRDRIALQYANGYADVFDTALPAFAAWTRRYGEGAPWAVTSCYVSIAARWPDTLIVRKHGAEVAESVRARFQAVETALKACENPEATISRLEQLDIELKRGGINPGTSADLTVATILAQRLSTLLRPRTEGRRAAAAGADG